MSGSTRTVGRDIRRPGGSAGDCALTGNCSILVRLLNGRAAIRYRSGDKVRRDSSE